MSLFNTKNDLFLVAQWHYRQCLEEMSLNRQLYSCKANMTSLQAFITVTLFCESRKVEMAEHLFYLYVTIAIVVLSDHIYQLSICHELEEGICLFQLDPNHI